MKKYILFILLILLFPFSVNAINATQKTLSGVTYYEYVPSGVNENTPVVFAFHGIGPSSTDVGSFGMTKVLDSNPSAVIIIPTKGQGAWSASTYGNFVKNYLSSTGYKGIIGYYGFSMGAINGPAIIQTAGVFTIAVFVDEDFIRSNNYSVDTTYNMISGISALQIYCGNECDSTDSLNQLKNKFESNGKKYNLVSRSGTSHPIMNSESASPGLSFILSNGTASGGYNGGDNSGNGGNEGGGGSGSGTSQVTKKKVYDFSYDGCPLGEEVTKDLSGALKVMKILAPIFVFVYTVYDTIVALTKGDAQAEGKKMLQKFLKRIAAALTLFAIPVLIDVLFQLFNIWDSNGKCDF
ncbi:MAG: hypothetical protein IKP76_00255, partial [Bacilli bacterium]|nr:hypothetical protein [Bacilli bacterium]